MSLLRNSRRCKYRDGSGPLTGSQSAEVNGKEFPSYLEQLDHTGDDAVSTAERKIFVGGQQIRHMATSFLDTSYLDFALFYILVSDHYSMILAILSMASIIKDHKRLTFV